MDDVIRSNMDADRVMWFFERVVRNRESPLDALNAMEVITDFDVDAITEIASAILDEKEWGTDSEMSLVLRRMERYQEQNEAYFLRLGEGIDNCHQRVRVLVELLERLIDHIEPFKNEQDDSPAGESKNRGLRLVSSEREE